LNDVIHERVGYRWAEQFPYRQPVLATRDDFAFAYPELFDARHTALGGATSANEDAFMAAFHGCNECAPDRLTTMQDGDRHAGLRLARPYLMSGIGFPDARNTAVNSFAVARRISIAFFMALIRMPPYPAAMISRAAFARAVVAVLFNARATALGCSVRSVSNILKAPDRSTLTGTFIMVCFLQG